MAIIPPPRPPRDRDAPHPAAERSGPGGPRRRVRVAAVGVTMFALGLTAGWSAFRAEGDGGRPDAPAEVREAGSQHEVADAARGESERRSSNGPADSDDGDVVGPATGTAATGSSSDRAEAKRATAERSSADKATPKGATQRKSTRKKTTQRKATQKKAASAKSSDKSSDKSSSGSSTTTPRDGTTTSRGATTDRDAGALSSTTLATVTPTTIGPAQPALPSVTLPVVRACSGLDCRMTASSGFDGIPIPDDAAEVTTAKGVVGWTTQVGTIEELTAWYLDHLVEEGWVLNGPASVMDPAEGELRELGHSTSAIYCPSDSDDPIVAVNVGWPAGDTTGGTVVIGIVGGIDESACN
jgi:hypothetical protein